VEYARHPQLSARQIHLLAGELRPEGQSGVFVVPVLVAQDQLKPAPFEEFSPALPPPHSSAHPLHRLHREPPAGRDRWSARPAGDLHPTAPQARVSVLFPDTGREVGTIDLG
jgi:hypothetical protein